MSEPARPGMDQGIFLAHYNKGREAYDAKRFDDAARELQEAYLLRPRDPKVLNLLGLVYFKLDRYDKAEEVYRKLVADSPEAHTLHYNLGLIYFKLNRLEEAESAFLKAQELSEENPKICFYLGSIYERQRRFQDAIYHYRQAGANIMVRRVEDKLAATRPVASALAPPGDKKGLAPAEPKLPRTDTARFRADDVRDAIRRAEDALAGNRVRPVGEPILAREKPLPSETARFRLGTTDATLPRGLDARLQPEHRTEPIKLPGEDRFRLLESSLLEVAVDGKLYLKPGTVYSYIGSLTFWVKERRTGGHPALALVTGRGKLLLRDKDRHVSFLQVEAGGQYVEPGHLLACEESLSPRYVGLEGEDAAVRPEFLLLEGQGLVALSVASRPLNLVVTPDLPVSVPAPQLITWSGAVKAHRLNDPELYESAPQPGGVTWVRLEGDGRVLVEQALD